MHLSRGILFEVVTNNGTKKQCALLLGGKTVRTDAECPALDVVENKYLGSMCRQ